MSKKGYVYILTNENNSMLYIGVTSDIYRRMDEHKLGKGSEFTYKYKLHKLIHLEITDNILDAIRREKQLKNWHKEWKWNLIKEQNPELRDLNNDWLYPSDNINEKIDTETSSA
ncbi:MAG: GIY-YIG nuclease family protein [Candidatus Delongbacteria bacterium]|jgi:putative endonuclease|nr:GIY-YIG nuclease family protein [Candidatus Delongbacteria bacterium]